MDHNSVWTKSLDLFLGSTPTLLLLFFAVSRLIYLHLYEYASVIADIQLTFFMIL